MAIDCEMVGVGPNGAESSVARVSIVNWHGAVVLDVYVKQRERVVDYRTKYSGIRAEHMLNGTAAACVRDLALTIIALAKSFDEVQKQVADLIKDRILVGHAVHNDLKVLLFLLFRHRSLTLSPGPPPLPSPFIAA